MAKEFIFLVSLIPLVVVQMWIHLYLATQQVPCPSVVCPVETPSVPAISDAMLQLMFSQSFQPISITPYWFSGSDVRADGVVTLFTMVNLKKLERMQMIMSVWTGPISLVLSIGGPLTIEISANIREKLLSMPGGSRLDIHLVSDHHPFQLNYWRNAARVFSRTRYSWMFDADFVPGTGTYESLVVELTTPMWEQCKDCVMVVPCFQGKGNPPRTKQQVLSEWSSETLEPFHPEWLAAQRSTNYSKWKTATKPYNVTVLDLHYEPYLILPETAPFCDMRFVRYIRNKVACVYEIRRAGFHFWVAANEFMFHRHHVVQYREAGAEQEHMSKMIAVWNERFDIDLENKYDPERYRLTKAVATLPPKVMSPSDLKTAIKLGKETLLGETPSGQITGPIHYVLSPKQVAIDKLFLVTILANIGSKACGRNENMIFIDVGGKTVPKLGKSKCKVIIVDEQNNCKKFNNLGDLHSCSTKRSQAVTILKETESPFILRIDANGLEHELLLEFEKYFGHDRVLLLVIKVSPSKLKKNKKSPFDLLSLLSTQKLMCTHDQVYGYTEAGGYDIVSQTDNTEISAIEFADMIADPNGNGKSGWTNLICWRH